MTDLQLLLLAFVVLYGLQCVLWAPEAAVVFRPWFRRWKTAADGILLPALGVKGVLLGLLPPMRGGFLCAPIDLDLAPGGVVVHGAGEEGASALVRYEDMQTPVASSASIRIGPLRLRTGSAEYARHLAGLLRELADTETAARGAAIAARLRSALDEEAVRQRLEQERRDSLALRLACDSLFFYTVVVLPLAIWFLGLLMVWLPALIVLLLAMFLVARLFSRAHRRLYPESGETRWQEALTIALSPLAAMRAVDALRKELVATRHPLAVAQALLRPEGFRAMASRVRRELLYPLPLPEAPGVRAAMAWSRQAKLAALDEFLRRAGEDPEGLCGAPPQPAAGCRRYCPRCWAQYVAPRESCADCPGIPLAEMAVSAAADASR